MTDEQSAVAFDPKALEGRIKELKERKMPAAQKKERLAALETRLAQTKQNQEFLGKLEQNVPKGTKLTVDQTGVIMRSKTPSGDEITTTFSPQLGYGFAVNGTINAGTVQTRGAQLQVASGVRSQYDAIVKSLPTGHVVETSAYTDDGKGASRQKAYERVGFNSAKPGKSIYAVKQADGSMTPGKPGKRGDTQWDRSSGKMSGSLWFSEGEDEDWRIIVFGERLR